MLSLLLGIGQRHVSVKQQSKLLLGYGACLQDPARGLLQLVLALIHLSEDKTLEEGKHAQGGAGPCWCAILVSKGLLQVWLLLVRVEWGRWGKGSDQKNAGGQACMDAAVGCVSK